MKTTGACLCGIMTCGANHVTAGSTLGSLVDVDVGDEDGVQWIGVFVSEVSLTLYEGRTS